MYGKRTGGIVQENGLESTPAKKAAGKQGGAGRSGARLRDKGSIRGVACACTLSIALTSMGASLLF